MIAVDDLQRTILHLTSVLSSLPVKYHFTGGIASSFYGEPRFTQDLDVVLQIESQSPLLDALIERLLPLFFMDVDTVQEEVHRQGLFQALDEETMIKVDFHVGEAIPHELERSRIEEVFPGLTVPVVSREDAILSKLLWVRQGSHKSRRDASMMLHRAGAMDRAYLERQAIALGVSDLLEELQTGPTPE